MNILFCGGCINRQQNITPAQHYHAIVKRTIEEETGNPLNSWQRFYSSFYDLEQEATEMLQRNAHYDYMVIFLRPFTLMPLTKLLIRYTDKNLQQKLTLNPKFSSARYYNNMIKEYKIPVQHDTKPAGVMHKIFIKANELAGDILGLHTWAHGEVIRMLGNINELALKKNTKLVLLGPPLYPFDSRVSKSCISLNNKIAGLAANNCIIHIDMVAPAINNQNLFSEPDGKHINLAGHAFMAEGIIRHLQKAIIRS